MAENLPKYDDALRGYAHEILKRDGFKCRYCGLNGQASFSAWLSLSWDHLLPRGDPRRDEPEFIVAACMFCNTADNHYFRRANERGLAFEGLTAEQLVEQRRPYVVATRDKYQKFWERHVRRTTEDEATV